MINKKILRKYLSVRHRYFSNAADVPMSIRGDPPQLWKSSYIFLGFGAKWKAGNSFKR